MRLKIGILQTDAVLEEFQPRYGDYPQMFARVLLAAAEQENVELELPVYPVYRGALPEATDDCDGYLITGSRQSVYDDLPWIPLLVEFLRRALADGVKIIGICFGHQLLAHFFGGSTGPAAGGWNVGVHSARVIERESWMQPERQALHLLSSHKDQVTQLPVGARVILSSDSCPVAGFVIGQQVMTVQGHPEFTRDYAEELMRKRAPVIGDETFHAGIASLQQETDEIVTAVWILNFLRGSTQRNTEAGTG